MFTRCVRELGEDEVRCKYQYVLHTKTFFVFNRGPLWFIHVRYYRAQKVCPEGYLEDWMDQRARGVCHLDLLPDRTAAHLRQ